MHPNAAGFAQQQRATRRAVCAHAANSNAYAFFNLLTGPQFFEQVESLLPPHRERLFPPTETLSMFLSQALSADRSCQQAVDELAVKRLAAGLAPCSTRTGAYCKARKLLPQDMVRTLACYAGGRVSTDAPRTWHWRSRPVRLVDGTTVTLPDTPANQAVYPQSHNQKPGLGFPLCRMVGLICLGSGAVLNAAFGPYSGKGSDEQSLLRTILQTLNPDDVLLGDAFYATYFLLCALRERRIDAVFEQHGQRQRVTDYRKGQRLGVRDHLLLWDKPVIKPGWMTQAAYDKAPATLKVRELHAGGKTLVTTLLCPKQTDKAAVKALYQSRWHVELDLRNIKTTLGMERLSCLTPDMANKEIWAYMLAYNLIRFIMAQAAVLNNIQPRQISFKHSVQMWIAWTAHGGGLHTEEVRCSFLILIAQQRVGNRPGRIEPRALKRRPKPYPLMTKPRAEARALVQKYGHPKKLK
jgi:hypothetical protein